MIWRAVNDPLLAALAPRLRLAPGPCQDRRLARQRPSGARPTTSRASPVLLTAPGSDVKADLARDVQAARMAFPHAILLTRVGGFMEVRCGRGDPG